MLLCIVFVILKPIVASITVGFLRDGNEIDSITAECMRNSSIRFVPIPACHNFNGLDSLIRLHFVHHVDVFMGAPCDQESETVSRLAFRWGRTYLSTSTHSSQSREKGTVALVPDLQRGLAKALMALIAEFEVEKVTIVFSERFRAASSYIADGMIQKPKLIPYPINADSDVTVQTGQEHSRVIIMLLSETYGMAVLNNLLNGNIHVTTRFIIYDSGWYA